MVGYAQLSLQGSVDGAWADRRGDSSINRVSDVLKGLAPITENAQVQTPQGSLVKLRMPAGSWSIVVVTSLGSPFNNGLDSAKRAIEEERDL